jgi:hypothetical protein
MQRSTSTYLLWPVSYHKVAFFAKFGSFVRQLGSDALFRASYSRQKTEHHLGRQELRFNSSGLLLTKKLYDADCQKRKVLTQLMNMEIKGNAFEKE